MPNYSEMQRTVDQLRDKLEQLKAGDQRDEAAEPALQTQAPMPSGIDAKPRRKARVIPLRAIPTDPFPGEGAHGPQVLGGEDSPLLAAALDYTRRGWPVLPLHSILDGRCTCGKVVCDRPGKHPLGQLVRRGVKDATTDADEIRAWWTAAPWANVGIATGAISGLVVLDVDPRSGGETSWEAMRNEHGALPTTPMVSTGGGGMHVFFARSGEAVGNRVNLAPGLDVRSDGGYVVAPPSLHASGSWYEWAIRADEAPLAEMPDWFLTLVRDDSGNDGVPDEEKPNAGLLTCADHSGDSGASKWSRRLVPG